MKTVLFDSLYNEWLIPWVAVIIKPIKHPLALCDISVCFPLNLTYIYIKVLIPLLSTTRWYHPLGTVLPDYGEVIPRSLFQILPLYLLPYMCSLRNLIFFSYHFLDGATPWVVGYYQIVVMSVWYHQMVPPFSTFLSDYGGVNPRSFFSNPASLLP